MLAADADTVVTYSNLTLTATVANSGPGLSLNTGILFLVQ